MRNSKMIFICFMIICLIYLFYENYKLNKMSEFLLGTVYRESPVERRAVEIFSKREGVSEEYVRGGRIPIEFKLSDRDCVSLELKKGILGSEEVICFSKDGKSVLDIFSSGE